MLCYHYKLKGILYSSSVTQLSYLLTENLISEYNIFIHVSNVQRGSLKSSVAFLSSTCPASKCLLSCCSDSTPGIEEERDTTAALVG